MLMVLKLDPPYDSVSYITGQDLAPSSFWRRVDDLFGQLATLVNGEFWWEDRLAQPFPQDAVPQPGVYGRKWKWLPSMPGITLRHFLTMSAARLTVSRFPRTLWLT